MGLDKFVFAIKEIAGFRGNLCDLDYALNGEIAPAWLELCSYYAYLALRKAILKPADFAFIIKRILKLILLLTPLSLSIKYNTLNLIVKNLSKPT